LRILSSMSEWETELELHRKYSAERRRARLELHDAQQRLDRFDKMVHGLEAVIPAELLERDADGRQSVAVPDEQSGRSAGPRGKEAIRLILEETPGRQFTPKELASEVERRGWSTPGVQHPEAAARAAANRLRIDSRFLLVDGGFVYNPFFAGMEDEAP